MPRLGVDEAEHVEAVLGVLGELAGDKLTDVARPDDDRVLEIDVGSSACGTGQHACGGHQDDRSDPEGDQSLHARMGDADHLSGEEDEPTAHGDEMEDADQVVRARVIRSLFVVSVEAVEVGDDDPGGQCDEEEHALGEVPDRVVNRSVTREEERREREGEPEAGDVGQGERAAHEPAAPPPSARGRAGSSGVRVGSSRAVRRPAGPSSTRSTVLTGALQQRVAQPHPPLPLPTPPKPH